jgi:hypothetical protein
LGGTVISHLSIPISPAWLLTLSPARLAGLKRPVSFVRQTGLPLFQLVAVSVVAALVAYVTVNAQLFAQPLQQQAQTSPQAKSERSKSQPQPSVASGPGVPSDQKIAILIFSSLIALNQANATGNYTVLREMGAPGFQAGNSPARLTEAFANLRRRKLDLSPVLLFQPKLLRKPEINADGMLRVTGFFPTQPERVNFDLLFQFVQGHWLLFGIAADTSPAPPPAAASFEPAPAQPADPAASAKPSTTTEPETR